MGVQGDLEHIAELTRELGDTSQYIEALEDLLRDAKARVSHIETVDLPMALEDMGIEKLSLSDGRSIVVQQVYSARINKGNETEAHAWLEASGEADLITERTVRNVHPATLNAWIKRRYQNGSGVEVPDELFHVFVGTKAVLK